MFSSSAAVSPASSQPSVPPRRGGGAATGDRVARLLAKRVLAHPRIDVEEGERMLALRCTGDRCVGVTTDRRRITARSTLLATGGASALWERTTNPAGSVGDGMAV